jgi:glycosyltransferase involved in cell wall biosynthesis
MARVLVITFSDLDRDPRPNRQIDALAKHHEVTAAGFGPADVSAARFIELRPPHSPVRERSNQAAGLSRILSRRFERAYWGNRLVGSSLARIDRTRPDLIVANEIYTLPLALRIADGAPVLFDAHEYYPEYFVQLRWWRLVMAPYFTYLCRRYMPLASAATTVSPGIAALYGSAIGIEPEVITNAPPRSRLTPRPVGQPVRLLHHGSADPRRRLERMVEAVLMLEGRFVLDLILVGEEPALNRLRRAARGDPRIRFLPPVPMRDIARVANGYDVGVYLLEPRGPNQTHSLPNKLFEFVQARLAIAVGPSPDMAELVRSYGIGVVADDFTPAAFARALSCMNDGAITRMKGRSHAAADELCAERNAERLLTLVERLLA